MPPDGLDPHVAAYSKPSSRRGRRRRNETRAGTDGTGASSAASRRAIGTVQALEGAPSGLESWICRGSDSQSRPIIVKVVGDPGSAAGRQNRVEVGAVVNRQAIDMVGRAGVDGVVNLDHVSCRRPAASHRGTDRGQRRRGSRRARSRLESRTRIVASSRLSIRSASRSRNSRCPFLPSSAKQSTSAPPLSSPFMTVLTSDRAGLLGRVVRLGLDRLRPIPYDERARIADAIGSDRRRS